MADSDKLTNGLVGKLGRFSLAGQAVVKLIVVSSGSGEINRLSIGWLRQW